MKHIAIFSVFAAVALLSACQEKVLTEKEKLEGRTSSKVEVSYSVAGNPVQALAYTHEASRQQLEVKVNNDGLIWNLESDKPWCHVVEEEHRGSGVVTLALDVNENFEKREQATLTFKAGSFRGFTITVDQSGSAFVFSQPYFVASKDGADFTVKVTTLSSTEWDVDDKPEWISSAVASTQDNSPVAGQKTTTLSLSVAANADDSRLGTVSLSAGDEKDAFSLWQFGNDLNYKDGAIYFTRDDEASVSLMVPRNVLSSVNKPSFAELLIKEEGENELLTFNFADNLSDCGQIRDVAISLVLSNTAATEVPLPQIKQESVPAGGLMTAEGMKMFKQKVEAGESTADWEKDGEVTVLTDIDMSGVTGWTGIGTPEHPFAGKFNGNKKSIKNLTAASSGLFNCCAGESETNPVLIHDLTLDKTCSIYLNSSEWPAEGLALGTLVNQASNTTLSNCTSKASLQFDGSDVSNTAWVGGILGKGGDGVYVRACISEGKMTVSATGETAYIGGIAGEVDYVRDSDRSGEIVSEGSFDSVYIGGITTIIGSSSTVVSNSFSGDVIIDDSSSSHCVGGLYAATKDKTELAFDVASDMSTVGGKIQLQKYKADSEGKHYAGGFIGFVNSDASLSFKGYTVQTSFYADHSTTKSAAAVCEGGVIGGCSFSAKAKSLKFENITPQGTVTFSYATNNNGNSGVLKSLYGGVAGFINGPAEFSGCINKGEIGPVITGSYTREGSSQNASLACMGGMVGYAEGGNVSISSCKNQAVVSNLFYNNNVAISTCLSTFVGEAVGGMIGAFDLHQTPKGGKLTISICDNSGTVGGFRGFVGGIAGFCQNASITSCNNTSATPLSNSNGYVQGGIVGCAIKTEIDGCTAKTEIKYGNGGNADFGASGGIFGRAVSEVEGDDVKISNCAYYGTVNTATTGKTVYPGGIVGAGVSTTTVTNCRFGGKVGSSSVVDANVAELVIGNKTGTATGTITWSGQ